MDRYTTDEPLTSYQTSFAWVSWLAIAAGILFHYWLTTNYWLEVHGDSNHTSVFREVNQSSGIAVDLNVNGGQLEFPALSCHSRFQQLLARAKLAPQSEAAQFAAMLPIFLISASVFLASNTVLSAALGTWLAIGLWWMCPHVEQWSNLCWEATLIGPVAGLYFAGLIHFHRHPGPMGWIALLCSSMLGWALFPVPWLLFFFPATLGWLLVAYRHGWLWHGWLFLAVAVAAAPFAPQWFELSRQWPTLVGLGLEAFETVWPGSVGNRPAKAALIITQFGLMLLPCVARVRHCTSAMLMVGVVSGLLVVGVTQPSAKSIGDAIRQTWEWKVCDSVFGNAQSNESIVIPPSSRILVESIPPNRARPSFFSMQPQPAILSGYPNQDRLPWHLFQGRLAGRLISDVTDEELRRLVDRWNISAIWASDVATIDRFKRWSLAKEPTTVAGGQFFHLDRTARYVLKGHAIWSPQPNGDILLTDVVPEHDEIVLSLRYYRNWTAGPGHAVVEPEIDPYDPLPIVRLKLQSPMSRILLRLAR